MGKKKKKIKILIFRGLFWRSIEWKKLLTRLKYKRSLRGIAILPHSIFLGLNLAADLLDLQVTKTSVHPPLEKRTS